MKTKPHALLAALKAEANGARHTETVTIGGHSFELSTIGPEASDWMLMRTSAQTDSIAGIALIMSSFRPAASITAIDGTSVYSLFEPEPSIDLTEAQIVAWKATHAYRNWLRDELHTALRDIVTVPQFLELQKHCARLDMRAQELLQAAQDANGPLVKIPSSE